MLRDIFCQFSCFGFSGSREVFDTSSLEQSANLVPFGSQVFVGCARGVDSFFREFFQDCVIFSVASGQFGSGKSAFALRSVACVRAVAEVGGLWVSFPFSPCPSGLLPSSSSSRAFSGSGSGSWASLALAVGSGVSCLVFLGEVPAPPGWGLVPVSGALGWWSFAASPGAVQLSLF